MMEFRENGKMAFSHYFVRFSMGRQSDGKQLGAA